ncbi:septum site-determining protein MinC [Oxobacter pfennigii]|uniref:Septum site-determining protein MinC n=1 Tax=Oxobacter pfennigii TaxID=36849 RepID=A0A0N8NTF0_9CLOT|nr:FapA family protein [Oxobacter pfennigii]KPU44648.1 septum site-determining protein MinC [Oxobacter pfennigii]
MKRLDDSGAVQKSPDKNGEAEIRGGNIIITDPEGSGREAVLSWGNGITVFLDEREARQGINVNGSSKISFKIDTVDPQRTLDITISTDKLKAFAKVSYTDGQRFKLKDKAPTDKLTIEIVPDEKIECPKYTLDEAKQALVKSGVIHGINQESLVQLIERPGKDPIEVATGKKPVDETDDNIVLKFDDTRKFTEVNDRVDYYSIGKVTAVEPGDLLAELIAGIKGEIGVDVTGKEIPFKKAKRLILKAGKGVHLSRDGLQAFADIAGRPELKKDTVNVHKIYEVEKDVDLSTGNIEFIGDVVVNGNINEGMKVKAGSSVIVHGNVTGGEIVAGGDVTIMKNAISSKIIAGSVDYFKHNLIDILSDISKVLMSIFSAASALKVTGKVPKIYKDGQIIKLLIDTKYNNLNGQITTLRNILQENRENLDMDTLRMGALLVKFFSGNGPVLLESLSDLKTHAEQIDNMIETFKDELKNPSNITVMYIQNSELSTTGNIVIKGKGCHTSDLNCRGDVLIEVKGSVTRGGNIAAGGNIKVYELGSASGAITTVSTGKDSTITCAIAHANSVIKVGEQAMRLDSSVKNVKAFLYKGELIVEKSKI